MKQEPERPVEEKRRCRPEKEETTRRLVKSKKKIPNKPACPNLKNIYLPIQ